MEPPTKPHLKLANPDVTESEPPRALRAPGRGAWNRIQREYHIVDCGGVELLMQICEAIDQIEELTAEIKADGGPVQRTRAGAKAHPAVKPVVALRSFVVRALQKLGITEEPVKSGAGTADQRLWVDAEVTWAPTASR